MSINSTNQLILMCSYVIIIVLLFVIRKYQNKLKKSKQEKLLISKTLNSFNPNDLQELNKNYQILIKMLDSIKDNKEIMDEKQYDKEIG